MRLTRSALLTLGAFLALWFGAAVIGTLLSFSREIEDLENQTWDHRVAFAAKQTKPDPRIIIVEIDQTSLDAWADNENQFWPWPRSMYVPVLEYLRQGGARAVAFDLLFTESSRFASDDDELAKAMRSTLPVVSAMAAGERPLTERSSAFEEFLIAEQRRPHPLKQLLDRHRDDNFSSAVLPIPSILSASAGIGNVGVVLKRERIFRQTSVGAVVQGVPILNLPFALFALTHPDVSIEAIRQQQSSDGRFVVRFHGVSGSYTRYPIDLVIQSWRQAQLKEQPQLSSEVFRDAFVFIGTTAPGLFDLRPTPLSGEMKGVEFNATVFDNLLRANFFKRSSKLFDSMYLLGVAILAAAGIFFRSTAAQLIYFGIGIPATVVLSIAAVAFGWWIPLVVPLITVTLASILSIAFQLFFEGRQRRFLKHAFGYYVSGEVISRIVADPSILSLGGERKEVTVFFSDIIGFTTISEKLTPPEVARFLNRVLSEMTDIILDEQGTIDKYEGDAIVAFWNAPLDVPHHERHAVRAALRSQKRLREIQEELVREFGVGAEVRIGLHTGEVVVGNFGSATRFNYTMIGDAANLASRIEGVNRLFNTRLLVSATCAARCDGEFLMRPVGKVRVVGRSEAVEVVEAALRDSGMDDLYRKFTEARAMFDAGSLAEAQEAFSALAEQDPVSQRYLERLSCSPPPEWDPVWVLTEK